MRKQPLRFALVIASSPILFGWLSARTTGAAAREPLTS